jgi:long-chain acyl-CoA synthetase
MSAVKTNKPGFYGKGSVEVAPQATAGETPVRRIAISSDALVKQPLEGINTVVDVLDYAARTHGSKTALGWRDIVDIHEEDKEVSKIVGGKEIKETKTWKYFQLSDYKYLSYLDVQKKVTDLSRGLVELGITQTDIFNLYAQTRSINSPCC